MDSLTRLIRYCKENTRSYPDSDTIPSSKTQLEFAKNILVPDMQEVGLQDVYLDESSGIVYGKLKANVDNAKKIGLIAHMDTADYNAVNINPIVHENYDGNPIELKNGVTLSTQAFPALKKHIGKTIVSTDGTTLLGGDDKAGIVIIMQTIDYFVKNPQVKHGQISVAFTPDEEIGTGIALFDLQRFDADYGFTLDGGDISYITDETFNAAAANVSIKGFSIHPGSAKDLMVNASDIAVELASMLPVQQRPQYTSGYEGFYYLIGINSTCDNATLNYIIRDHDMDKFKAKKQYFTSVVNLLNEKYNNVITLDLHDQYYNMHEILKDNMYVFDKVLAAYKKHNIEVQFDKARGGTDGCQLCFKGLPCPNLGTGDYNCHGPSEFVVMEDLNKMVEILIDTIGE